MFAPTLQTTSPLESGDTYRADPLAGLNPAQREAVLHGLLAPDLRALLVIAGAGSGKTSTLAHRVGQLIKHGVDPQRILLLTFSRRASLEMQQLFLFVAQLFQREPGFPSIGGEQRDARAVDLDVASVG